MGAKMGYQITVSRYAEGTIFPIGHTIHIGSYIGSWGRTLNNCCNNTAVEINQYFGPDSVFKCLLKHFPIQVLFLTGKCKCECKCEYIDRQYMEVLV